MSNEEMAAIASRCKGATKSTWKLERKGRVINISNASSSDHDFIMHAKQDISKLLDEVRQLKIIINWLPTETQIHKSNARIHK
jgi:hypothetical protein